MALFYGWGSTVSRLELLWNGSHLAVFTTFWHKVRETLKMLGGKQQLLSEEEWFWQFEDFSKLKAAFCEY